ncbi:hypothetical protein N7520_003082 [Penicillium odoratum]|uniref:uncharacterized protein n=1 Tax=Penicillium odoratum TaxID=1167516 RepID=UPI00254815B6|nr:uncharacterized protein N7520_003082 [Penicillium odoratum]KAJ5772553.1 hypothetical protein N7520_003082 [Penicillium odoratum]
MLLIRAGIAEAQLNKRKLRSTCSTIAKYVWIGQKTLEVVDYFYTDVDDYVKGVCERQNKQYCASILTEVRAAFDLALKLLRKAETAIALAYANVNLLNLNPRSLPSDPYYIEALKQLHL